MQCLCPLQPNLQTNLIPTDRGTLIAVWGEKENPQLPEVGANVIWLQPLLTVWVCQDGRTR